MMNELVSSGADLAAAASFASGFVEPRVWTTNTLEVKMKNYKIIRLGILESSCIMLLRNTTVLMMSVGCYEDIILATAV